MNLGSLAERVRPQKSSVSPTIRLENDVDCVWIHVKAAENEQIWSFRDAINMRAGLSIHRWKIWWTIPRLVYHEHSIPPESYLLLCELQDPNAACDGLQAEPYYLCMLANIDHDMGFSLSGSSSSDVLELHGHYNGVGEVKPGLRQALLMSISRDPFTLMSTSIMHLKSRIRSHFTPAMRKRLQKLTFHASTIPPPEYPRGPGPSFVDSLGWCTWDSFYTDLSEEKVLYGLESFKNTNVRPGFLILDDGWQCTDVDDRMNCFQWGGRLTSFKANYKFSPEYSSEKSSLSQPCSEKVQVDGTNITELSEGVIPDSLGRNVSCGGHSLRSLVDKAKDEYGIKNLMVWHTLSGYWNGVSPEAPEMKAFNPKVVTPQQPYPISMSRMSKANALEGEPFTVHGVGVVHQDSLEAFFTAYHSTLKAMGVSGVKVDAQSVIPALTGSMDGDIHRSGGWELTIGAHVALQNSVAASFGKQSKGTIPDEFPVMHCMCHSLHTLLSIGALYPDENDVTLLTGEYEGSGAARLRPVVRGSDDYWPNDPASHGPHLFANAMNSMLISHVGLQDWDMFRTDFGRTSHMHAAARAISGGPVYVSDVPEAHDSSILQALAFSDGAVPRCLRNVYPVRRALFTDPQRQAGVPLLLQNVNAAGGGVVGAFSIAGAVLEDDKDCFRFLSPKEMIWPDDCPTNLRDLNGNEFTLDKKAVYEESNISGNSYLEALRISGVASPMDVEEIRKIANIPGSESLMYIALRNSDKTPHLCAGPASAVPFSLPQVFDYELVSFSPLKSLFSTRSADKDLNPCWIAVIGAKDMYNAGGTVLDVQIVSSNVDETKIDLKLLGSGKFWIALVQSMGDSDAKETSLHMPLNLSGSLKPLKSTASYGEDSYDSAQDTSYIDEQPVMHTPLDFNISVQSEVRWIQSGHHMRRDTANISIAEFEVPSANQRHGGAQRSAVRLQVTKK